MVFLFVAVLSIGFGGPPCEFSWGGGMATLPGPLFPFSFRVVLYRGCLVSDLQWVGMALTN
jgi:hypothetical protein